MGVDAEAYSAYLHIMSLRGQALEGIQERYKVLQVYYSEWDGKPTIVLNLKTKKDNDKAS